MLLLSTVFFYVLIITHLFFQNFHFLYSAMQKLSSPKKLKVQWTVCQLT